jgi:urease accessory protein
MAWGLVGHVAGLDVDEVTHLVAYHCVSGPASAALRLLGLDPRAIQALLWHLGPEVDAVAHRAAVNVAIDRLPGRSSTLVELGAELHRYQEMRLFAS